MLFPRSVYQQALRWVVIISITKCTSIYKFAYKIILTLYRTVLKTDCTLTSLEFDAENFLTAENFLAAESFLAAENFLAALLNGRNAGQCDVARRSNIHTCRVTIQEVTSTTTKHSL